MIIVVLPLLMLIHKISPVKVVVDAVTVTSGGDFAIVMQMHSLYDIFGSSLHFG
jgi:hypothetical protein